jgi:hypothetical protein
VSPRRRGEQCAVLLLVCTVAGLTGCGSESPSETAFRAHVTRVCRHISMASPVTRLGYAKQQRQASMDLATLARLHPPTSGERQTYRDLLMHLTRIDTFFKRNESGAIALDRATAHPRRLRPALRRVQRFLRPIAGDTVATLRDTSVLHLDECPTLIGL